MKTKNSQKLLSLLLALSLILSLSAGLSFTASAADTPTFSFDFEDDVTPFVSGVSSYEVTDSVSALTNGNNVLNFAGMNYGLTSSSSSNPYNTSAHTLSIGSGMVTDDSLKYSWPEDARPTKVSFKYKATAINGNFSFYPLFDPTSAGASQTTAYNNLSVGITSGSRGYSSWASSSRVGAYYFTTSSTDTTCAFQSVDSEVIDNETVYYPNANGYTKLDTGTYNDKTSGDGSASSNNCFHGTAISSETAPYDDTAEGGNDYWNTFTCEYDWSRFTADNGWLVGLKITVYSVIRNDNTIYTDVVKWTQSTTSTTVAEPTETTAYSIGFASGSYGYLCIDDLDIYTYSVSSGDINDDTSDSRDTAVTSTIGMDSSNTTSYDEFCFIVDNTYNSEKTVEEVGFVCLPTQLLGESELTLDTENAISLKIDPSTLSGEDYVGIIKGVRDYYMNVKMTVRSFIKYKEDTVYIYSDALDISYAQAVQSYVVDMCGNASDTFWTNNGYTDLAAFKTAYNADKTNTDKWIDLYASYYKQ